MNKIKTPVVLVTGASRGLGRGIAKHLAASGFSVAINYIHNRDAALQTAQLCDSLRIKEEQQFLPIKADISNGDSRKLLLNNILEKLGRIDALVNNAGIAPHERKDIIEASEESFDKVITTNLKGPYFLTQSIVRYWINSKTRPILNNGFKIIFITSVSAEIVSSNRGEYCISKAGLSMAAKLWALRLADLGIQVFEIRPGIMKTDMTKEVQEKYDILIRKGLVPEKRWGSKDDVGKVVTTLILGYLPFATGSTIHIDGGLHLPKL